MPKIKEKSRPANNERCLMVSRGTHKLFTEEKNYKLLLEFSRKFNAELQVVKVDNAEIIIDLKTLAKNLCDPLYVPSKTEIKIDIIDSKLISTAKIKEITGTLDEYIEKTLKNNKKLSISKLREKWCNETTDYKKVYNTFQKIKTNMQEDGWIIDRIERGIYTAKKPANA